MTTDSNSLLFRELIIEAMKCIVTIMILMKFVMSIMNAMIFMKKFLFSTVLPIEIS